MRSTYTLANLKTNWKSGLTIALISIPLAISLAVASGVSPVAGIITAMWAGGVAAIFGGSNFNIISATGALSGIIATFALNKGVAAVPMLAIAAGVFILIAWLLRLEKYLIFIPSSVIHGFIVGIAAIITLNQIGFAFGLRNLPPHERLIERVGEVFKNMHAISWQAFFIFVLFFGALLFLRKFLTLIPGIILLAPIGIVVGYLAERQLLPLSLESLGSKFGAIEPTLFKFPQLYADKELVITGAVVAFVSIIETMLAAKIADALTKTKHNPRREIMGVGLANMASGLAGGFPVTAALALTTSNIRAGATSRVSALLSSICIAAVSLLFLPYFSYIPMAVIAAILVYVAINMVEQEHIIQLWRRDKVHFFIVFLVAAITVYEDPTIGILVGSIMALLLLVNKLTESFHQVAVLHEETPQLMASAHAHNILVYTFKGKLVYLNSQAHLVRFHSDFTQYGCIILVLNDLYYVDSDGVDALDEIIESINSRGQGVALVRANEAISQLLLTSHAYQKMLKTGFVFDSIEEAMAGCSTR